MDVFNSAHEIPSVTGVLQMTAARRPALHSCCEDCAQHAGPGSRRKAVAAQLGAEGIGSRGKSGKVPQVLCTVLET